MTPMSAIYDGMMKEVSMTETLDLDLSKIRAHCLAIHSKIDKDVPISHLEYLEYNLKNIRTMHVECMGHYVWWGNGSNEIIEESLLFLHA